MKYTFGIFCMALFLSSCGNNTNENSEETAAPLNQEEAIKDAGIVTVYSHRHYDVDKKIFTDFEEKTGIKVMVKEDKASKLIELIAQKGDDAASLRTYRSGSSRCNQMPCRCS